MLVIAPIKGLKIENITKSYFDLEFKIGDFPVVKFTNNPERITTLVKKFEGNISQFDYSIYKNPIMMYSEDHIENGNLNEYCLEITNEIRVFFKHLWLIKDNSINFTRVYGNSEGQIICNMETNSFSNCFGKIEETTFSFEEIENAMKKCSDTNIFTRDERKQMKGGSLKKSIAHQYLNSGRVAKEMESKILFYCSALEALYLNDNFELKHRLSERVALYTKIEEKERITRYDDMRKVYDARSTVAHGSKISIDLEPISKLADEICRESLNKFLSIDDLKKNILEMDTKELNDYFLKLIMK